MAPGALHGPICAQKLTGVGWPMLRPLRLAIDGSAPGSETGIRMKTIGSADGTLIAVEVAGEGPPLLLLSGGSADHHNWDHVTPLLATHFTTYGVDRRGRGRSDDRSEPGGDDLAREVEDINAVIAHVGEPMHVLGHSGGAVCALEAALQGANVGALMLYEPPLDVSPTFPRGLADELQPSADAGDMEGVLVAFLRNGPRLPEAEITSMRASPSWQPRVADALRILREIRLVEAYRPDEMRLQQYDGAVLLLIGTATAAHTLAATDYLSDALRNTRVVTMQGEGHMAMHTAPDVLAREVASFVAA